MTEQEIEYIFFLEEQYKKDNQAIPAEEIKNRCSMTEDEYSSLIDILERHNCIVRVWNDKKVSLQPEILRLARKLRQKKEVKPNLVTRFEHYLSRNRIGASFIITLKYGGPLIVLIGGILGIMALVKSCK